MLPGKQESDSKRCRDDETRPRDVNIRFMTIRVVRSFKTAVDAILLEYEICVVAGTFWLACEKLLSLIFSSTDRKTRKLWGCDPQRSFDIAGMLLDSGQVLLGDDVGEREGKRQLQAWHSIRNFKKIVDVILLEFLDVFEKKNLWRNKTIMLI